MQFVHGNEFGEFVFGIDGVIEHDPGNDDFPGCQSLHVAQGRFSKRAAVCAVQEDERFRGQGIEKRFYGFIDVCKRGIVVGGELLAICGGWVFEDGDILHGLGIDRACVPGQGKACEGLA